MKISIELFVLGTVFLRLVRTRSWAGMGLAACLVWAMNAKGANIIAVPGETGFRAAIAAAKPGANIPEGVANDATTAPESASAITNAVASNDTNSEAIAKAQQQGIATGIKDIQADEPQKEKNVLIIGASSLRSPLHELVDAMLESRKTPMNVEPGAFGAPGLDRKWNSGKIWDYVIMDAWQFKRGATDAPGFPEAITAFVKQVRAHNPQCEIILFTWWIPSGPDATKEGVMKVFQRCVEAARQNGIWVATTGPAFMEARLARPDLRVTVSEQDAHPGIHGAYINACSLFAILTGGSPVGLPATMKLPGIAQAFTLAPDDAKYLQELAWNVFQRERKHTKPGNL